MRAEGGQRSTRGAARRAGAAHRAGVAACAAAAPPCPLIRLPTASAINCAIAATPLPRPPARPERPQPPDRPHLASKQHLGAMISMRGQTVCRGQVRCGRCPVGTAEGNGALMRTLTPPTLLLGALAGREAKLTRPGGLQRPAGALLRPGEPRGGDTMAGARRLRRAPLRTRLCGQRAAPDAPAPATPRPPQRRSLRVRASADPDTEPPRGGEMEVGSAR